MTKSNSLFNLGSNAGTPVKKGPTSLFDSARSNFDTPKKKEVFSEDKRADFIRKQKENELKLKKKKEEQEAERIRKNKEKEEKRQKVKERQEQQQRERQLNLEKKNQQAKEKASGFKNQRAKLEEAQKREEMKRMKEMEAIQLAAAKARAEESERLAGLNRPVFSEETVCLGKKEDLPATPVHKGLPSSSYEMTPHGSDKPFVQSSANNYNIDDLSSGDETDDDENPRKQIPKWAQKSSLNLALKLQYKYKLDTHDVFQGCIAEPSRLCDLVEVLGGQFKRDPKRMARLQKMARRDTEMWNSEMKQPRELMDKTLNLDVSCFPPEEPRPIKNRNK